MGEARVAEHLDDAADDLVRGWATRDDAPVLVQRVAEGERLSRDRALAVEVAGVRRSRVAGFSCCGAAGVPRKYPDELRERAVRLVLEDDEHGAIARVADRLDINRETLRNWVNAERRRPEQPEAVDLEAENARLRKQLAEAERDKEILKAASSFLARELDRPQRR